MADGRDCLTLRGHTGAVKGVRFSPDGSLLASASEDFTIKLWVVADGRERLTLGASKEITSILLQGDFNRIPQALQPILLATHAVLRGSAPGHLAAVRSVDFSPDSVMLASGSDDATIKLWDARNGAELSTLRGHADAVCSVAFSPDGSLLVSGGADHLLILWNVATRREIRRFSGQAGAVQKVVFSPDGKLLASASDDRTVVLWPWDPEQFLTDGCQWISGYLKHNPHVSEEDRGLCDGF